MDRLHDQKKYYGSLTVAKRALLFFGDVQTKTAAYKQIIDIVNLGYSDSVLPLFVTGDLQPDGGLPGTPDYEFSNNYNFYKFLLNQEKNLPRWAKNYLEQIDQEKFSKYSFYQAMQFYQDKKLDEADKLLTKILSKDFIDGDIHLVKKVARTQGRIRFEKKDYAGSLEIYEKFLLKTNPVTPSDYLEAAWNLFYLKRYQEALGYVYNLESKISQNRYNLEVFELRGLIYRNLCADQQTNLLAVSFRNLFNPIVLGVKLGVPLKNYPILDRIEVPQTAEFRAMRNAVNELKAEQKALSGLTTEEKKVAQLVYGQEIALLNTQLALDEDAMRESAAEQVILLSEKIRFLKFEVVEQRYDPEAVFKQEDEATPALLPVRGQDQIELRWKQFGDYWRDERLEYRSTVQDRCKN